MNKTEKRHFKVYTSKHTIGEKNKYVQLFDAIDKQQEYDEFQLLKQGITSRQLVVMKNRLYEIVLKSLDAYFANDAIETQLRRQLHYIKILNRKGLFQQCERQISKAKATALKYEKQSVLLELLKFEADLIYVKSFETNERDISNLQKNVNDTVKKYQNELDYIFWVLRMAKKDNEIGNIRGPADLSALKKMLQFSNDNDTLSYWSKLSFYFGQSIYLDLKEDYSNAYNISTELVKFMESNPHQIHEAPIGYVFALDNHCTMQLYLKQYNECAKTIQKLKVLPMLSSRISERIKTYMYYITNIAELTLYCKTGEFDKAKSVAYIITQEISRYESASLYQSKKIALYYQIACSYFGSGNYVDANKYINIILNEPDYFKMDVYCFTRILSLLVYFEMGKDDLIEYRVKSVHRFLYKRKRLYKLETIILDFISKELPKINSDKELFASFKLLLTKFNAIANDPFERKALDYFDFVSWLESKIEGKAFAEMVREKAEKKC